MYNKKIFALSVILSISLFSGCNNQGSTSSFDSTKISETSSENGKTFSEMLEAIKNPNITYHSDYLIYYYFINNPSEVIESQHFDIYAKITEELYDMKAYIYGTDSIASFAHLEKDAQGYVTYNEININNELVSNRAIDNTGNAFKWVDSVYYNLIAYMDETDFEKIDESTYSYKSELSNLPINVIHTAVPLSSFDLESFVVNVVDDKIESFVFQEKESSQAWEGCMYGRKITLRFEDIGTTSIEKISPYKESDENKSLDEALSFMKSQTNYTIISEGILDNGEIMKIQDTYITELDILQRKYTDSGMDLMGLHTYEGELYSFEPVDGYLYGEKVSSEITVSSFLPTFDFSAYVFEYLGEDEEGNKKYRPYQNMVGVLDYIDVLSYYSEAYYSPAGDIYFFVKDGTISKIEFPIYVYSSSEPLIATNRLTFKNFDKTKIGSSTWSKFVTEIPENTASTWYDEQYQFYFEITTGKHVLTTLGDVFDKCIGDSSLIPYFIPSKGSFNVSGNKSDSDNAVYLTLTSNTGYKESIVSDLKEFLDNTDYQYSLYEDEIVTAHIYQKDNIKIEIICLILEGHMEVAFTLPFGDIDTLK